MGFSFIKIDFPLRGKRLNGLPYGLKITQKLILTTTGQKVLQSGVMAN